MVDIKVHILFHKDHKELKSARDPNIMSIPKGGGSEGYQEMDDIKF